MWNITNQQADPMTFTLDDGTIVNAPAHHPVQVGSGVLRITYHQLTYQRVGGWVFAPNLALNAFYPGGNNVHLQSPDMSETVYQHL
jgi:hypothetical protein